MKAQASPATAENIHRISALLFALVTLGVVMFQFQYDLIGDADTLWHIKTGEWIVANGTVPATDVFSHSFFGEPWIAKEWLSQVAFYFAYTGGGWKGVVLFTGLAVFVTAYVLSLFCLSRFRWSAAIGAVVLLMVFASPHFLARPHILSFPILVIWVIELSRATDEGRLPRWWMIPLMALWTNLHGGFTLGLVLAAIFGFETILNAQPQDRVRQFIHHALFGAALATATLINPYGYEAILITQKILSLETPLKTIYEWQSPDFQDRRFHLYVLIGLLGLALLSGFRLRKFRIAALLLLLFLALNYNRSLATFALCLPVIAAASIVEQFQFSRAQTGPQDWEDDAVIAWIARHVRLLVIAAAGIFATGALAFWNTADFDFEVERFPKKAVEFAQSSGLRGNVFNDYVNGGYLIFEDIPTGIDGRAELFGNAFYERYGAAMFQPGIVDPFKVMDELNITWTLMRPGTDLIPLLEMSGKWRCVYADDWWMIHLKTGVPDNQEVVGSCKTSSRD